MLHLHTFWSLPRTGRSKISDLKEREFGLWDFEALRRTMTMARLLGARPVLAGLRAGVVSSLVELGAETDDLEAARDLDDAFRIMETPNAATNADDEEEFHAGIHAAPPDQV